MIVGGNVKRVYLLSVLIAFSLFLGGSNIFASEDSKIQKTLLKEAPSINHKFLDNAVQMYQCAKQKGLTKKKYLGVIDFTLPSYKKRLWIFNMDTKKLLYHTWVAHGKGSGGLYARRFSNQPHSHESSIGLYLTDEIYRGGHGASLHLRGKEKGFNDNAYSRYIVMHGAWYVSHDFIKKYGRLGRSFGCPAVPNNMVRSIIRVIKEGSVLIAYYPKKKWINNSRFFECN